MELIWLEDFAALAEHGNFSRAAEARHVTQPAFSRRIRSLETWIGTELFQRTPQGAVLTPAGRYILASGQDMIRGLHRLRRDALEVAGKTARTLEFAATHSLSFTFFPAWIRRAERGAPIEAVRLLSDSMAECEQRLTNGQAHFLLCHRHEREAMPAFPARDFAWKVVGEDCLIPLQSAAAPTNPQARPYLAYTAESGLGRIVSSRLALCTDRPALEPLFSSHLAAVLMSMVLQGKGLAWLPRSLADQDIQEGRLVRALPAEWDIPLQICLVRSRTPLSAFAESFWADLSD